MMASRALGTVPIIPVRNLLQEASKQAREKQWE